MNEIQRLEKLRHDVRAFFIFFITGALVWIFVLAAASAFGGHSFLFPLGIFGLFSAAAMIGGCFLGFLFGIPRVLASSTAAVAAASRDRRQIEPNTNLEQISDWLTKVLVGVGLTELDKISTGIANLSDKLDKALVGVPAGGPVAVATIMTFGSAGFLWVYFECRTSIFRLFSEDNNSDNSDMNSPVSQAAMAGTISGAATGALTGAAAGAAAGSASGAADAAQAQGSALGQAGEHDQGSLQKDQDAKPME